MGFYGLWFHVFVGEETKQALVTLSQFTMEVNNDDNSYHLYGPSYILGMVLS